MRRIEVTWLRAALLGAILFLMLGALLWKSAAYALEDAALAVHPTAARAANFGRLHMSSVHGYLYDLSRAEALYRRAADLDPRYPYVFHQLARIFFLRGDLERALVSINMEISLHGDSEPIAFYVRGLIEGYKGDYDAAAEDYGKYVSMDPQNWAGLNDYAWVLLKAGRNSEARDVAKKGVGLFPYNPWLLNTYAIALYELGEYKEALSYAEAAVKYSRLVPEKEWLRAYPGNHPDSASSGMRTLRDSADENLARIEAAIKKDGS